MDDRFEATFVVRSQPIDVWAVLAPDGDEPDGGQYWLPGFESTGTALEVDAGRRLRVRKDSPPCEGTEIVLTLEAVESGTRITVVQSGFGSWFESMAEWLEVGWGHIVADLALYLDRGIAARRHLRPWASIGCAMRAIPLGLEVLAVEETGFAREAGLMEGDVVLTVGGAPVLTVHELATVMRVLHAGDNVEATWARGRELRTASAVL